MVNPQVAGYVSLSDSCAGPCRGARRHGAPPLARACGGRCGTVRRASRL